MYFITIPKDGVLGGIALGPDGRSVIISLVLTLTGAQEVILSAVYLRSD